MELSVRSDNERDELFKQKVYKELSSLMECVFKKHDRSFRRSHCHLIVDIWPMTERIIFRLHQGIFRRLRATPVTASPYFFCFTREVSKEVFDVICKQIINHNSFGHTSTAAAARVSICITGRRKGVYLFNYMNDEGIMVDKCKLMKKELGDNSYAKVIISEEKPMTLKFSKNMETFAIFFPLCGLEFFWSTAALRQ